LIIPGARNKCLVTLSSEIHNTSSLSKLDRARSNSSGLVKNKCVLTGTFSHVGRKNPELLFSDQNIWTSAVKQIVGACFADEQETKQASEPIADQVPWVKTNEPVT
jgi:hypothetical protein